MKYVIAYRNKVQGFEILLDSNEEVLLVDEKDLEEHIDNVIADASNSANGIEEIRILKLLDFNAEFKQTEGSTKTSKITIQ